MAKAVATPEKQAQKGSNRFQKGNKLGRKFEPGKSANPGGVVKGSTFISEAYKRLMALPRAKFEAYTPKNIAEEIAYERVRMALNPLGLPETKEITDRTEGKPAQQIIHSGNSESPVLIVNVPYDEI